MMMIMMMVVMMISSLEVRGRSKVTFHSVNKIVLRTYVSARGALSFFLSPCLSFLRSFVRSFLCLQDRIQRPLTQGQINV